MEQGKRKIDEAFYFLNIALRLWKQALVVKLKPRLTVRMKRV
jgi:hypothetical protein